MATPIQQDFAGEERSFLVRLGELRKIEERCEAGVFMIAGELSRCVYTLRQRPNASLFDQLVMGLGGLRADYVREPILQGLIAGGMASPEATKIVRGEIDDRGFMGLVEAAPLALAVLIAGVSVPKGTEPLGEPTAGTAPPDSTGTTSTPPAEASAGTSAWSTRPGSGSSAAPSPGGTEPKAQKRVPGRPRRKSTTP